MTFLYISTQVGNEDKKGKKSAKELAKQRERNKEYVIGLIGLIVNILKRE